MATFKIAGKIVKKKDLEKFTRDLYLRRQKDRKEKKNGEKK